MAKIDFNFSGWVRGADVTKVTVVETLTDLDVSDKSASEIIEQIRSGVWSISLGDYLYENKDSEIEVSDFEESV